MKKTWKPTVAGIIDIVLGGLVTAFALILLIGSIWTWDEPGGGGIFLLIAIPCAVFGIPSIIGGIYALRRKRWLMALIGSICIGLLNPIGIAAIIFVALSVLYRIGCLGGAKHLFALVPPSFLRERATNGCEGETGS